METSPKLIRQKYPKFIYNDYSYSLSEGCLFLQYEYKIEPDLEFKHRICFEGVGEETLRKKDPHELDNFVFNIGVAEVLSYWKLTAAPEIVIRAGQLNRYQVEWWYDLYMNGMGQYFYQNNLDMTQKGFLEIKVKSDRQVVAKPAVIESDDLLVPIGGGKDSAVTLETMLKKTLGVSAFIVNPSREASFETVKKSGVRSLYTADRMFDPLLFKLNKEGFLNGHIPITAILSFMSLFRAYLSDCGSVVFSNERGSGEGNVAYLGKMINHQYSKTLEFENNLRDYNRKILSNINYFSLLRPLYDIQITKLFSGYPKYFTIIKSCNVGAKEGVWCCECPKCLSTYILLFAHLGQEKISEIFPKNLFEDDNLIGLMEELIMEDKVKPFECVGTREELKVGLFMSLVRYKDEKLPSLLKRVKEYFLINEKDMKERTITILKGWSENNNLPSDFNKFMKE